MENDGKIRITTDDLERVNVTRAAEGIADGPQSFGSVDTAPALEESKGNFFLKGWVYLGCAGLVTSLMAWAICEP